LFIDKRQGVQAFYMVGGIEDAAEKVTTLT
jgi:hypothetical protein